MGMTFSFSQRQVQQDFSGNRCERELFDEDQTLRRLTRKLLAVERKELASLRRQAFIHDEVFFQLSRELDIEETRLSGQRI